MIATSGPRRPALPSTASLWHSGVAGWGRRALEHPRRTTDSEHRLLICGSTAAHTSVDGRDALDLYPAEADAAELDSETADQLGGHVTDLGSDVPQPYFGDDAGREAEQ